jgi:hypothetical protein
VELNVFPNEAHLWLAEFEGRQYLVTEYVDGGTLRDWVKQESVQKGLLEWIETDLTMDPHNFLRLAGPVRQTKSARSVLSSWARTARLLQEATSSWMAE